MDLGLLGKKALITGASAGLGLAAARILLKEGAKIAICSRDEARIKAAAISLSSDSGKVLPLVCDLTKASDIVKLLSDVQRQLGGLDILVTNCGGPPTGRHDSITEKDWEHAYNLTFMSTIRLIQEAIPSMKQQKYGRIVLITSTSAKQPIDNLLLSNSYRAGLLGYAKTISRELAPFGITVNTVMPGYMKTERLEYLASDISAKTGRPKESVFSDWIETVPAGRLGNPEELATFIAFLASDKAAYITGTTTAVDGGRMAGI